KAELPLSRSERTADRPDPRYGALSLGSQPGERLRVQPYHLGAALLGRLDHVLGAPGPIWDDRLVPQGDQRDAAGPVDQRIVQEPPVVALPNRVVLRRPQPPGEVECALGVAQDPHRERGMQAVEPFHPLRAPVLYRGLHIRVARPDDEELRLDPLLRADLVKENVPATRAAGDADDLAACLAPLRGDGLRDHPARFAFGFLRK